MRWSILDSLPRVEGVAQAVAEEARRQDDGDEHEGRIEDPLRVAVEVLAVVLEHLAEADLRRGEADPGAQLQRPSEIAMRSMK